MKLAIEEAKNSKGEIPVGAILVKNGNIICKTHNEKEKLKDVTCHAEILAIREAEKIENNWRLDDYEMYVTLEPCPMCGWAILQSRIGKLYFGSYDTNYGTFSTEIDLRKIANSNLKVYGGINEEKCNQLLNNFFENIR